MSRRLFTSESVTEGHPDKIADQISDTILDALLTADPTSRVAVETLITTGQVHIAGEVTTTAYVDIASLVRAKILEIGYDSSKKGFDGASCGVSVSIGAQSPDIAQGVDTAYEKRVAGAAATEDELDKQGAGDQGLMFGYASDETPELMPLPITLAHRLSKRLTDVRKNGTIPYLRPDGKTQVTIEYDGDKAVRLDTVVVSTQHASDIDLESLLAPDIREFVVEAELKALLDEGIKIDTEGYRLLVNPTGRFEIGGPMGDAGLTGRKIIIDTYGGMARHGGGAFSGKDPSKVDRSAAYAMRWVAKNVVAAGLAARCEVQVAYAIGKAEPVGLFVETFGTENVDVEKIEQAISEVFDLRPAAIIRDLDLLRPIYAQTAAYGHFGRDLPDFTWEKHRPGGRSALGRGPLTTHRGPHAPAPAPRFTPGAGAACCRPGPAPIGGRTGAAGHGRGRGGGTAPVSEASGRNHRVSGENGQDGEPPADGEQLALIRETVAKARQPRAKPRTWRGAALAEGLPVARVLVDKGLLHLDQFFDYAVPAAMDEEARPGVRVRVRFGARVVKGRREGGTLHDGFVVERRADSDYSGPLAPLAQVLSTEAVLTPPLLRLCRQVADRYAGALADVVQLAVPPADGPRRARPPRPGPHRTPSRPSRAPGRATPPGPPTSRRWPAATRPARCGSPCPGRTGRASWPRRSPPRWPRGAAPWPYCPTAARPPGWTRR